MSKIKFMNNCIIEEKRVSLIDEYNSDIYVLVCIDDLII